MIVIPILRGGAANCLFGMATAISYSLKHGVYYSLPITVENPHNEFNPVMVFRELNYCWVKRDELKWNIQVYREQFFHYQEIPKYDCDYLFLDGYFQSYKYIQDYRNEILHLLNIPYSYKEGMTFIHHRLGDYRRLQGIHEIVSDEYLQTAIKYFTDKGFTKFMVFSDEPELAKQVIDNLPISQKIILEYSECKTEIEDLSLMASCQNGIMSASAFSWWGAWLGQNENRLITYPSKWFGEKLSYNDTKDLCPENWRSI